MQFSFTSNWSWLSVVSSDYYYNNSDLLASMMAADWRQLDFMLHSMCQVKAARAGSTWADKRSQGIAN